MIRCRLLPLFLFGEICGEQQKRQIDRAELNALREATREMLEHAYGGYERVAYPRDELMPVTCQGRVGFCGENFEKSLTVYYPLFWTFFKLEFFLK